MHDFQPIKESLLKFSKTLTEEKEIEYNKLITLARELPCSIINNLRILPDEELTARLKHILGIIDIIRDPDYYFVGKNIEFISVENEPISYPHFDHDILLKIDNKLTIIDVTFSDKQISLKQVRFESSKANICRSIGVDHIDFITITPRSFNIKVTNFKLDPHLYSSEFRCHIDLIEDILSVDPKYLTAKCFELKSEFDNILKEVATDYDYSTDPDKCRGLTKSKVVLEASQHNTSKSIKDVFSLPTRGLEFLDKLKSHVNKLAQLNKNNKKWIFPFPLPEQFVASDKDLKLKETLYQLKDNYICHSLYLILIKNDDKYYKVSKSFELIQTIKPKVPSYTDEESILIAKHLGSGRFEISFSTDVIDSVLKDSFRRTENKRFKIPNRKENNDYLNYSRVNLDEIKDDDLLDELYNIEDSYKNLKNFVNNEVCPIAPFDIYSKIAHVSKETSENKQEIDFRVRRKLSDLLIHLSTSYIGTSISYEYEVYKSVASAFSTSPGDNLYKVGVNGCYNSISITRVTGTQDSFKNSFFFVVNKSYSNLTYSRNLFSRDNDVNQTESFSVNRNSIVWNLKKPFTFLSYITWLLEYKQRKETLDDLLDSYLICSINRDPFATASELTRYFYVSTTGRLSKPSDILDKFKDYHSKNIFETIYLIRQAKMAFCLYYLKCSGKLTSLTDKSGSLKLAFPHETSYVSDNDYHISSFYICNIYNKFKFHVDIAEATCYLDLIEEDEIYKAAKSSRLDTVLGLSHKFINDGIYTFSYLSNDCLKDELELFKFCASNPELRFKGSLLFTIVATEITKISININSLDYYRKMNKGVIDVCTIKGSMSGDIPTKESQSNRAASTIFETILDYHGVDPQVFNKNETERIIKCTTLKDRSTSLVLLKQLQYNKKTQFSYRITHKDQKGNREITSMNGHMRLGALFSETLSRLLSTNYHEDVLDSPNKDEIIFNKLGNAKYSDKKEDRLLFDNNDQKRWGPNHLTFYFAIQQAILLKSEEGLVRLTCDTLFKFLSKIAKYPENLLQRFFDGVRYDNSNKMGKLQEHIFSSSILNKYGKDFEWGMCQGILHATSSLYHAISSKYLSLLLLDSDIVKETDFITTSDDCNRIHLLSNRHLNNNNIKLLLNFTVCMPGCLNIIRSKNKSCFNTYVGEMNSIFFFNTKAAIPSIKNRISCIDCGEGHDTTSDFLLALGSSVQYIKNGGSYEGSLILQILNVTFTCEQWKLFHFMYDNTKTLKSTFLGALPIISPAVTLSSGPIGNFYIRESLNNLSIDSFISLLFANSISKTEDVSVDEYLRSDKDSNALGNIDFITTPTLSGLITLVRPPLKVSRLFKRNKLADWRLYDDTLSLQRDDPRFGNLLIYFILGVGNSQYEDYSYTNTLYRRLTEPWIKTTTNKYRLARGSFLEAYIFKKGLNVGSKDKRGRTLCSFSDLSKLYSEKDITEELINFADSQHIKNDNLTLTITNLLRSKLELAEKVYHLTGSIVENVIYKSKFPDYKLTKYVSDNATLLDTNEFQVALLNSVEELDTNKAIFRSGYDSTVIKNLTKTYKLKNQPLLNAISTISSIISSIDRYTKQKAKAIIRVSDNVRSLSSVIEDFIQYNFSSSYGIVVSKELSVFKPIRFNQAIVPAVYKIQSETLNVAKEMMPNFVNSYQNPVSTVPLRDEKSDGNLNLFSQTLNIGGIGEPLVYPLRSTNLRTLRKELAVLGASEALITTKYENIKLITSGDLNTSKYFKIDNTYCHFLDKINIEFNSSEIKTHSILSQKTSIGYKTFVFLESKPNLKDIKKDNILIQTDYSWLTKLFDKLPSKIDVCRDYYRNEYDMIKFIPITSLSKFKTQLSKGSFNIYIRFYGAPLYLSTINANYKTSIEATERDYSRYVDNAFNYSCIMRDLFIEMKYSDNNDLINNISNWAKTCSYPLSRPDRIYLKNLISDILTEPNYSKIEIVDLNDDQNSILSMFTMSYIFSNCYGSKDKLSKSNFLNNGYGISPIKVNKNVKEVKEEVKEVLKAKIDLSSIINEGYESYEEDEDEDDDEEEIDIADLIKKAKEEVQLLNYPVPEEKEHRNIEPKKHEFELATIQALEENTYSALEELRRIDDDEAIVDSMSSSKGLFSINSNESVLMYYAALINKEVRVYANSKILDLRSRSSITHSILTATLNKHIFKKLYVELCKTSKYGSIDKVFSIVFVLFSAEA